MGVLWRSTTYRRFEFVINGGADFVPPALRGRGITRDFLVEIRENRGVTDTSRLTVSCANRRFRPRQSRVATRGGVVVRKKKTLRTPREHQSSRETR